MAGGKGSRARTKARRKAAKSKGRLQRAEEYAAQGKAGKHKVKNQARSRGLVKDKPSHSGGPCGNVGCSRCFPRVQNPLVWAEVFR